jgi:hypothetical protein
LRLLRNRHASRRRTSSSHTTARACSCHASTRYLRLLYASCQTRCPSGCSRYYGTSGQTCRCSPYQARASGSRASGACYAAACRRTSGNTTRRASSRRLRLLYASGQTRCPSRCSCYYGTPGQTCRCSPYQTRASGSCSGLTSSYARCSRAGCSFSHYLRLISAACQTRCPSRYYGTPGQTCRCSPYQAGSSCAGSGLTSCQTRCSASRSHRSF